MEEKRPDEAKPNTSTDDAPPTEGAEASANTNVPEKSQVVVGKSNRKLGKAMIALIVVLAALIVGGGATYTYYKATDKPLPWEKQKSAPLTTDKTKKVRIDDRKTYTSEQLKFTFKYPADWSYTDTGYANDNWTHLRSYAAEFKPAADSATVVLYVDVNPWTTSASPLAHIYDDYERVSTETVKIDSVDATKEVWQTTDRGIEIEGAAGKGIDYRFTHGTDKFRLHFAYRTSDETAQLKNINDLVASLHFTAPGN